MAGLVVCITLVLFPVQTISAQVAQVSVDELTKLSTSVVHGTAEKIRSYWTDDEKFIMTDVVLRVEGAIKGSGVSETTVTIPGGRVGSRAYEVSDMPVFVEGEEVVVFTWQLPSGETTVTGGVQGKFTVVEDRDTREKVVLGSSGLFKTEVLEKAGKVETSPELSLDDFRRRIKEIDER